MSHPEPEPSPPGDTANLHLRMLGKDHTFSVPIPLGERTVLDLLPAARELTAQATAVVVDDARAQGREISCRAGCGACCRQLVVISYVEAQDLADLVAAMPPERQAVIRARFVEAVRRLEAAGVLGPVEADGGRALLAPSDGPAAMEEVARRYFRQQIPCPFLDEESCSIHPRRPLVCREYHVTSPAENCARLYQVGVERLHPPLHMGDVLAQTAHRVAGTPAKVIPLVLSLEWAEARGAQLKQPRDGMEMFRTMIGEIDTSYARPFEERASETEPRP